MRPKQRAARFKAWAIWKTSHLLTMKDELESPDLPSWKPVHLHQKKKSARWELEQTHRTREILLSHTRVWGERFWYKAKAIEDPSFYTDLYLASPLQPWVQHWQIPLITNKRYSQIASVGRVFLTWQPLSNKHSGAYQL